MRLTVKEKAVFREELLKKQDGMCSLCGTSIQVGEATLDHDHETGRVRRVLHRSCNQVEGRILSWIKRCRATNKLDFLTNLLQYWSTDYRDMPLHPSHLTETEQKIKKLRKRMKKLKRERTRQKYRDMIKELKEKGNGR